MIQVKDYVIIENEGKLLQALDIRPFDDGAVVLVTVVNSKESDYWEPESNLMKVNKKEYPEYFLWNYLLQNFTTQK